MYVFGSVDLDVQFTPIEWVHIEGEELRMEDGVWVRHTVTRCVYPRGGNVAYAKCPIAYWVRPATTEPCPVLEGEDWDFFD